MEAVPEGQHGLLGLLTKIKAQSRVMPPPPTSTTGRPTRQMRSSTSTRRCTGSRSRRPAGVLRHAQEHAEYVYGATQWDRCSTTRATASSSRATRRVQREHPTSRRGLRGLPRLRGGRQARGQPRRRQGREQIAKLELRTPFGDYKVDQDGVQNRAQDGHVPVAEGKKVIVWPTISLRARSSSRRRLDESLSEGVYFKNRTT